MIIPHIYILSYLGIKLKRRQTFYLGPANILSFLVKWMRDNMLELVETVTTEGGASSDEAVGDYLNRRKKY